MTLTERLKQTAYDLGFSLVGVCPASSPAGFQRLAAWLEAGYAGEMRYLSDRYEAYSHPRYVLEGVRSLLMLGWSYGTETPRPTKPGQGRVSRYAWGEVDYHDFLRERLQTLAERLREWSPSSTARGVVDTAPLLEREFAQLAGLGWIGKNTLLINRSAGSWFFLAALLTNLELDADAAWETDHCGSCRACLDACPTQAFPAPYVLDASRCVSYLTIELRGPAPESLRTGLEDWLFGCDVCQDVCPWNRRAPPTAAPTFRPVADRNPVDLAELLTTGDEAFRERFRATPLWRAKRRGILRNAAYVLGNQRTEHAVSALLAGLNDVEPLVRGACAWALGEYRRSDLVPPLTRRRDIEADVAVREEIDRALSRLVP